ncbi:hypothetical protein ACP70R_009036 [Stipagrostis hirtigluma subsp. patula]
MARSLLSSRPCSSCRVVFLVLLLVAVMARPSSCSRPLPLRQPQPAAAWQPDDLNNNGGRVKAEAGADMVLALPTVTVGVGAGVSSPTSRDGHRLAGGHMWVLDMKPRGKAPPSAPSKRTNDIKT